MRHFHLIPKKDTSEKKTVSIGWKIPANQAASSWSLSISSKKMTRLHYQASRMFSLTFPVDRCQWKGPMTSQWGVERVLLLCIVVKYIIASSGIILLLLGTSPQIFKNQPKLKAAEFIFFTVDQHSPTTQPNYSTLETYHWYPLSRHRSNKQQGKIMLFTPLICWRSRTSPPCKRACSCWRSLQRTSKVRKNYHQ